MKTLLHYHRCETCDRPMECQGDLTQLGPARVDVVVFTCAEKQRHISEGWAYLCEACAAATDHKM